MVLPNVTHVAKIPVYYNIIIVDFFTYDAHFCIFILDKKNMQKFEGLQLYAHAQAYENKTKNTRNIQCRTRDLNISPFVQRM